MSLITRLLNNLNLIAVMNKNNKVDKYSINKINKHWPSLKIIKNSIKFKFSKEFSLLTFDARLIYI